MRMLTAGAHQAVLIVSASSSPQGRCGSLRAAAVIALIALSACAEKNELPPLTPRADLCIHYSSFRYSAAAAAVEALAALDAHNANEAVFMEKCLLGDRAKSLGPR